MIDFSKYGISTNGIEINISEFALFRETLLDPRPIGVEKYLEYFVSTKMLGIKADDLYLDVASQDCPLASIIRRKYGCNAFSQDLIYLPPGLKGGTIGGDAGRIPLPDGSVTKIALHNSFEHFEENADSRFILEAQRLLSVSGKMIIIPLYISENYSESNLSGWTDAAGVFHLWGEGARFSRIYDLEQFMIRVLSHSTKMSHSVFRVLNANEITGSGEPFYFIQFEKVL